MGGRAHHTARSSQPAARSPQPAARSPQHIIDRYETGIIADREDLD
ncbi:hypothetical protein ACFCWT_01305 [Streptomyces olivaceus]